MAMKFTNNATSTLATGINSSVTSLSVASGQGALFPTLGGSDYFYCTLANVAGTVEIVKVTARSTDTFTIVRGQDGTTANTWLSGDRVELRLVAASLNDIPKLDEANSFTTAPTFGTALGVASGGTGGATAADARTALGLVIGTDVQAYDADLTTWAGKTAPTGTVVGTSDTQTLTNKTITGTKETVYTITDGAGFEIDPANGGIQVVTLGASRSPAATNFTAGQSMILGIDDGSAYTITWPTITWATSSGTAPTLATSGYTWVVLWKVGSTLYGKY